MKSETEDLDWSRCLTFTSSLTKVNKYIPQGREKINQRNNKVI